MASSSKISVVAQKKVQPLANLTPDQESSAIVVTVLRKSPVYSSRCGNQHVAFEMVLVDKEGTMIQAHIDKPYIYKHDRTILEGSVYNISKFTVALNYGQYRAARHEYKLNFKLGVLTRPVATDEVPFPAYNFTPPEQCFEAAYNRDFLVDVAGVLTGIGTEQEFYKDTGMSTRMKIDLDNRGYRYSVTLFGEYVADMKKFVSSGGATNVVVAILFCKVGTWPGGISIQTTMHTTKMLFNHDISETIALRETMSQALTSPSLTVSQATKNHPPHDDFLNIDQKYTLVDAKELVEDIEWWYWACRCSKKCTEDEDEPDMRYCPKCDTHVTKVTRKFFLKLRIIDEIDSLNVVLFDHTARVLIGKSSEEVYLKWKEDPGRDYLPSEVMALKGKEAIFRIQCEGTPGGKFPRSYRMRNVSEDSELINSYKAKWDSEAAIEANQEVLLIEDTPSSVSVTIQKGAEGLSQDLIGKFDESASDSCTVGTATDTVDITRDTDETPTTKRKVPTDSGSSSMKMPLKSIKIEK